MWAALVRFAELSWRLGLAISALAGPVRVDDLGGAAAVGSVRGAPCGAVARRRARCLGEPRPCRAPGSLLRRAAGGP